MSRWSQCKPIDERRKLIDYSEVPRASISSYLPDLLLQAKKKLKQGKISSFFSAKDTTPTVAPAAEPTTSSTSSSSNGAAAAAAASDEDSASPLLRGGRHGLRVLGVRFGIGGGAKHNNEGRAITVEYDKVRLAYVT